MCIKHVKCMYNLQNKSYCLFEFYFLSISMGQTLPEKNKSDHKTVVTQGHTAARLTTSLQNSTFIEKPPN